jgi:predicted phage-related endonuclease
MNELITIENGTAVLAPETAAKLAEFERKAKEIKEAEDEIRAKILEEMQQNDIKKIETDDMVISFVDASDRETFQTKEFRAEHADLYDEYVKITTVKPSVRIKLKESK